MKTQDDTLAIPNDVVYGSSNCGRGFYIVWDSLKKYAKECYASSQATFPEEVVRQPKNNDEQLFHFLYFLRRTMVQLGLHPIGERTSQTPAEIAQMLTNLPRRAAFIRSGEDIGVIYTDETPELVGNNLYQKRLLYIHEQTRQFYCKPKDQVESEIKKRSEDKVAVGTVSSMEAEASPQEHLPLSRDNMNTLYKQMKAKAIDSDTTILAALGEHYVLTIRQWMRPFEWKSYPKATQYFKDLREQGLVFRKDREGRGGNFVSGDWFFLLSKGANELARRKQGAPLFKLEPSEAERASGDTLFHTYLVNEILIHLRLLERSRPDLVTIEQLDHERNMRRVYLAALGAEAKVFPDGFLRLLVPTANGLKRRSLFLEPQHTTQKDEANWKTKCRKYLALFERADVLEQFFRTKTPQVLILTMQADYVTHHKRWTEELLAEQGGRGEDFSNRFLISSYDAGISDMQVTPEHFFCTERFFTPYKVTPHALFGT